MWYHYAGLGLCAYFVIISCVIYVKYRKSGVKGGFLGWLNWRVANINNAVTMWGVRKSVRIMEKREAKRRKKVSKGII